MCGGQKPSSGEPVPPRHHVGPGELRSHTWQQARDPLRHLGTAKAWDLGPEWPYSPWGDSVLSSAATTGAGRQTAV